MTEAITYTDTGGGQYDHLPYRPNVGVMVINAAGAVFVAQRLDRFSDAWQMPQGGIDPGEDPWPAALRELHEETGIPAHMVEKLAETDGWLTYELPQDLIPKLWGGKFRGQKQKWYLLRFTGRDCEININTDHPEFSAWKWITPNALPDTIVPFKRDVYIQVLNTFKGHL